MPGLHLYTSNRLELLAYRLAKVIEGAPLPPFQPELIVVQSRGMERWVSLRLAEMLGISANCRFPFPNTIVDEFFDHCLGDPTGNALLYARHAMAWRIFSLLPHVASRTGYESIREYLDDDRGGLKRLQLSASIADVFDQYTVFRPEMLQNWEERNFPYAVHDEIWQVDLWSELVSAIGKDHRGSRRRRFLEKAGNAKLAGLPERVSVFGISYLPRFHLDILRAVATVSDVHLFVIDPCREFWRDVRSEREIARLGKKTDDLDSLHLETGNPLLAGWGGQGKGFLAAVDEAQEAIEETDRDRDYEDPGRDTILHAVQSDILNLTCPEHRKEPVASSDRSLQVHNCHSPMREMEVLYDALLDMFEANPTLTPADVVVMTPDIETCSPYIHAVFDHPYNVETRIPFSIADRRTGVRSELADGFLRILRLSVARITATEVIDLLENDLIAARFELSASEREMIREWIRQAPIRWGIDSDHRKSMGLPPLPGHTWKAGLERLLLGYAMQSDRYVTLGEIAPFPHIEGDETVTLGKLSECTGTLFDIARRLRRKRTIGEWIELLKNLLQDMFADTEQAAPARLSLFTLLDQIAEDTKVAGCNQTIGIETITWWLEQSLASEISSTGFLSHGVTFCEMLPMRAIPFQVVCLTGMGNDAYPRVNRRPGFDLIAQHPMIGDRSKREDDLYLFLESLLAARQIFYVSYTGQSLRDNSDIPPSVLISQLLDYLDERYECEGSGVSVRSHVVTRHRLHAFSSRYFDGSGLFSYSEENCAACNESIRRAREPAFCSDPLESPPSDDPGTDLTIDDIRGFLRNPSRYFLRQRLGVALEQDDVTIDEQEPFVLDGRERYRLGQMLLTAELEGVSMETMFRHARAAGMLPHGNFAGEVFDAISTDARELAERVRAVACPKELSRRFFTAQAGDIALQGYVDQCGPDGAVGFRYTAKLKAVDRLAIWLDHLLLCCQSPSCRSVLLSREETMVLGPVENANNLIIELVRLVKEGVCRPIPLFPESSWAYADEKTRRGKDAAEALAKAAVRWYGAPRDPMQPESSDPYMALAFRGRDPLDHDFESVSETVCAPIFRAIEAAGD